MPRQRLTEIIAHLPRGGQFKIAKRCNCSSSTVSSILNGYQNQSTDLAKKVIRCAERLIEENKRIKHY